jgi:hypothetical protein
MKKKQPVILDPAVDAFCAILARILVRLTKEQTASPQESPESELPKSGINPGNDSTQSDSNHPGA